MVYLGETLKEHHPTNKSTVERIDGQLPLVLVYHGSLTEKKPPFGSG